MWIWTILKMSLPEADVESREDLIARIWISNPKQLDEIRIRYSRMNQEMPNQIKVVFIGRLQEIVHSDAYDNIDAAWVLYNYSASYRGRDKNNIRQSEKKALKEWLDLLEQRLEEANNFRDVLYIAHRSPAILGRSMLGKSHDLRERAYEKALRYAENVGDCWEVINKPTEKDSALWKLGYRKIMRFLQWEFQTAKTYGDYAYIHEYSPYGSKLRAESQRIINLFQCLNLKVCE